MKLEGGRKRLDAVRAILDAEIPVMGHLGLTPQSFHTLGGYRVQGRDLDAARAIVDDAIALADAGCFAVVLECVPDAVARLVTDSVEVPTVGIGAGRHCDGQVLVFHDLVGLETRVTPKFVRRYADLAADATSAVARFADDVRSGRFPSSDETYHAADGVERRPAPLRRHRQPARPGVRRAGPTLAVAGVLLTVLSGPPAAAASPPVSTAVHTATPAQAPFPGLTAATVHLGGRPLLVVVAQTEAEREEGLRERATLGPYGGMLFVFASDTSVGFTMSTVPVALDIGFYRANGSTVGRLRMRPCAARRNSMSRVPGPPFVPLRRRDARRRAAPRHPLGLTVPAHRYDRHRLGG